MTRPWRTGAPSQRDKLEAQAPTPSGGALPTPAEPFDRIAHPDVRVLEVTCNELNDWESSIRFMDRVCEALGHPAPPKTPEWLAANRALHGRLRNRSCGKPDRTDA